MDLILVWLLPVLAGLSCLAARSRASWERLNLAGFAAAAVLAGRIACRVAAHGPQTAWEGFLRADALSALVLALTAFVALVCAIYAVGYFRRDEREGRLTRAQARLYYTLTPVFTGLLLVAPLADNLGVMWVTLEAGTLSSALLVALYNQKTSFEAGWKYMILGSVGISVALFGTVMLYYSAASTPGAGARSGMNWSVLAESAAGLDSRAMRLAFVLALVGYGTKAGLAPMHTWKPDAYSEAPAPVAALLGAGFINCALYAVIRFHILASKNLGHAFPGGLLAGFGVATILVAAPFVLAQRNYRRLLAYSSIDHAGIMAAGLGFGGPLGALGVTLHMLFHAVTKPLMFFCAGTIQQQFGSPFFWKVRGAIHTLPWTAGLFLLGALAVTGVPPFGIFQSEFTILAAAFAAGRPWMAFLFVVGVVTVFIGFLAGMSKLVLGAGTMPRAAECPWALTAMAASIVPALVLGFWIPAPLFSLVRQAALIIQGAP